MSTRQNRCGVRAVIIGYRNCPAVSGAGGQWDPLRPAEICFVLNLLLHLA